MNESVTHESRANILIVDDDRANIDVLRRTLEAEGHEIFAACDGLSALEIARSVLPHLILLDVLMPEMDGFEVCHRLKRQEPTANIPVIFITVRGGPESIVQGFHAGGVDYIVKPFQQEEVLVRVETHLKIARLTKELMQRNRELEKEISRRKTVTNQRNQLAEHLSMISRREEEQWGIASIVGKSRIIKQTLSKISQLSVAINTSVLIIGESGTGKELVARAIHYGSAKVSGPFVPVNCASIPGELAESLIFGHIRGAFTGANADQRGYFELADGGTLFLDEMAYMPLEIQTKLLRVLEDGIVIPIGTSRGKRVDVRVIAAASTDLETMMLSGKFRQELYFRLARFKITVPPLRERREDIPLLARHFLRMFAAEMGMQEASLGSEALQALEDYYFPGNVRELKNIIEHALIESGGAEIQPEHLHFIQAQSFPAVPINPPRAETGPATASDLPLDLDQAELTVIKRALAMTDGNITRAARMLRTNRMRIYRALAREEEPQIKDDE